GGGRGAQGPPGRPAGGKPAHPFVGALPPAYEPAARRRAVQQVAQVVRQDPPLGILLQQVVAVLAAGNLPRVGAEVLDRLPLAAAEAAQLAGELPEDRQVAVGRVQLLGRPRVVEGTPLHPPTLADAELLAPPPP